MPKDIKSPIIDQKIEIPGTKPLKKPTAKNDIISPIMNKPQKIEGGK